MSTSEEQQLLYHYTSFDAFEKIIRSQVLRATEYRFTNDDNEAFEALKPIRRVLRPILEELIRNHPDDPALVPEINRDGGAEKFVRIRGTAFTGALFEAAFGRRQGGRHGMMPPFICSFCDHSVDEYTSENGLLSMWRDYGKEGVAVVFDRTKLEGLLKSEGSEYCYVGSDTLLDVVYSSEENEFENKFHTFFSLLKENTLRHLKGEALEPKFIEKFFLVAAGYKHRGFREESEVRIAISPIRPESSKDIHEVCKGKMLKPIKESSVEKDSKRSRYIELFDRVAMPELPIVKVIMAPQKDQFEKIENAKRVLEKNQFPGVHVVPSQTPYTSG